VCRKVVWLLQDNGEGLAGIGDRIILPVCDTVLLLGDEPPPAKRFNYGRLTLSVLILLAVVPAVFL
jgi:hypothetical protein